jgi:hypothetical protein
MKTTDTLGAPPGRGALVSVVLVCVSILQSIEDVTDDPHPSVPESVPIREDTGAKWENAAALMG